MTNSCVKGKTEERRACKYLESIGFPGFARTQQHKGNTGDAPDIEQDTTGLESHQILKGKVHIEVKSVRDMRIGTKLLEAALWQADLDAGVDSSLTPVVLWWEHRRGWRISVYSFSWYSLSAISTYADDQSIGAVLLREASAA